jgi:hypothetical protein
MSGPETGDPGDLPPPRRAAPGVHRRDSERPSSEGPSSEGPSSEGPGSEGPGSEGPGSEGPSSEGPSAEGSDAEGPKIAARGVEAPGFNAQDVIGEAATRQGGVPAAHAIASGDAGDVDDLDPRARRRLALRKRADLVFIALGMAATALALVILASLVVRLWGDGHARLSL